MRQKRHKKIKSKQKQKTKKNGYSGQMVPSGPQRNPAQPSGTQRYPKCMQLSIRESMVLDLLYMLRPPPQTYVFCFSGAVSYCACYIENNV